MNGQGDISATLFRTLQMKSVSPSFRSRYLWIAIFVELMNLTAVIAHAQQLAANDFVFSTKNTGGWWSERISFVGASNLQLLMASLSRFDLSNPESRNYHPSDSPVQHRDPLIENLAGLRAGAESRDGDLGLFAEGESSYPQSFLSSVETKYLMWKSTLADTRTLTYANGAFVYPLLQLTFAESNLPVTLYVTPLLAADVRR
jgi:hypothetical protein